MILEVAQLRVRAGQADAFVAAFAEAERYIKASRGYVRHELRRCIEDEQVFLLQVHWESVEDHTVGFRGSAEYESWKRLLHHFYDPFPEVLHYPEAVPGDLPTNTPGPVTLDGDHVRLEPLRPGHCAGLVAAARDDRIWQWLAVRAQDEAAVTRFVSQAMDAESAGREFAFAVIDRRSDRLVGSTRYMDIDYRERGLEIGWTWYDPAYWQTAINPEAKLLLLRHAFEKWGAIRVYFKTDELNERSRRAIGKLGAAFEGILRNHRVRPDGSFRGSAVYSIVADEWPAVERRLVERLAAWSRAENREGT